MNPDVLAIDAPYPGFRPYDRHESSIFFGRGSHLTVMLRLLRKQHFLAVVGSSGCGKSSLIRAGLLPSLADGWLEAGTVWKFVIMRPGDVPFANLAEQLISSLQRDRARSDSASEMRTYREATLRIGPNGLRDAIRDSLAGDEATRVFVLVDQFEEIFRFRGLGRDQRRHPQNDAAAFVEMLLSTARARDPRVFVGLTMRSDFLGECDAFYGLPQAISSAQFLPPRLTRDELREVIELPLRVPPFRGSIEPQVTTELLNAIDDSQDLLPLLQHVLRRMWTMAEPDGDSQPHATRRITLEHYRECGGLNNALDRHATGIYESELTPAQQAICERMFRCLIQVGDEGRQTRRLATVQEVGGVASTSDQQITTREVTDVVKPFLAPGCSFLLVSGGDSASDAEVLPRETRLDISHESLVRQWRQLRDWAQSEQEAADLLQRLIQSMRLLRGKAYLTPHEVHTYDMWEGQHHPNAEWARRYVDGDRFYEAMQFLNESRRHVIETEAAEETRRRQKLKRARQSALVLGSLGSVALVAIALAVVTWLTSKQSLRRAISTEVDKVRTATPTTVMSVLGSLKQLDDTNGLAVVLLQEWLNGKNMGENEKARIRLGLFVLAKDDGQIEDLREAMLATEDIEEMVLIRDAIARRVSSEDMQTLWKEVDPDREPPTHLDRRRWIRAAAALAKFAPNDDHWKKSAADVAEELAVQDPLALGEWLGAFSPAGHRLIEPLKAVFRRSSEDSALVRFNAAVALAEYLKDDPDQLSELVLAAEDRGQFAPLIKKLTDHSKEAGDYLTKKLDVGPLDHQVNAAIALLAIGRPNEAWSRLRHTPDPTRRTMMIHRFQTLGIEPGLLFAGIGADNPEGSVHKASVHRAIILALGEYPAQRILSGDLTVYAQKLLDLYRTASDPGIHATAEWTLNQWKADPRLAGNNSRVSLQQEIDSARKNWPTKSDSEDLGWYLSASGQKMVVVPAPNKIEVGSPESESGREDDEQQHEVTIDWSFAIADKEVTQSQFQKFLDDKEYVNRFDMPEKAIDALRQSAKSTPNQPAVGVSWFVAAAYCNWLTEKEFAKKDVCYAVNDHGKYEDGMKIHPDFLERAGYRLPLEIEWEYACRAGATTRWCFGEEEQLLDKYAKWGDDGFTDVGGLKPNDLGLFALHGNAIEWCQDEYFPKHWGNPNVASPSVSKNSSRVLRGGKIGGDLANLRSASRNCIDPDDYAYGYGFRVVRTHSKVRRVQSMLKESCRFADPAE